VNLKLYQWVATVGRERFELFVCAESEDQARIDLLPQAACNPFLSTEIKHALFASLEKEPYYVAERDYPLVIRYRIDN
jgi:hypothetical protein